MALIFLFRRLVFAQVLLAIVAFFIAEGNPGMLLIAGALGALSWYVVEGPTGRPLPQWVILPGAVLALCWLMPDLYWQHNRVIVAMGHFIMWLQVLLLYARKTNREYAQLLALSLMQMVSAGVLTSSLIFGVLLLVYCVLALFTVLLFQLKVTSDEVIAANEAAAPRKIEPARPKAVVGAGHRWQFRAAALAIGAAAGLIAVVVFLIVPRARHNFMGQEMSDQTGARETGFATTIQLGGPPMDPGSQAPVLNITLTIDGKPVDPNKSWLLRGWVLDSYFEHTRTWTRSGVDRFDRPFVLPPQGLTLAPPPPGARLIEAKVSQRLLTQRAIFSLSPLIDLRGSAIASVTFNPFDQQLDYNGNLEPPVNYTSRSLLDAPPAGFFETYITGEPAMAGSDLGIQTVGSYASGWPDRTGQVRDWALGVLKQFHLSRDPALETSPADAQIAQTLATYMQENFRYSLSTPPLGRRDDPIIEFLLNRKEGHCEYFAAGLAAALRSIGIRARLISGYRVSEFNPVGGYYIVRQGDAHAWTEAYCPPRGWVTLDSTPPAAVASEHQPLHGVLAYLRDLYENVEFSWLNNIAAYDTSGRDRLMQSTVDSLKNLTADKDSWVGKVVEWFRAFFSRWQFNRLAFILMGAIVLFIAIGLLSLVRILVVRARRLATLQLNRLPRKQQRKLAQRLRFYLQMLDMLESHGHIRPDWQSPFSFAKELADANPMRFDPVIALTEIFYEVRFGHRDLDDDRQNKVRAHLKQLEASLAKP